MQLYYSLASPFARKVQMLALAGDLPDLELVRASPLTEESLRTVNPLGKVPALVDGDRVLIDSPLICEYLDDRLTAQGKRGFLQKNTSAYYHCQQLQAIADGISDAAVATVMERRRPDAEQSTFWMERWHKAMHAALTTLDVRDLGTPAEPHIGTLATIAALGYIDFRLREFNWREPYPALARWLETFKQITWVAATQPRDS